MSVLGLWTLASALGCCIGFTIIQRPAEYYDYRRNPQDNQRQPSEYQWQPSENEWQPSEYQWHPLEYQWQPTEYQEQPYEYQPYDYQPYDYQPYDYQPYDYQPYDYQPYEYEPYEYQPYEHRPYEYQPSYSSYYYPLYELSVPYSYDTKLKLPYAEAQHLLQVYRVIRVIVLFRDPVHEPVTSLDLLVHELTDKALQEKLTGLLYHVPGYKEVAELKNYPSIKSMHSFVNDYRRLLLAIQRALNALDLTTKLDDHLGETLRELRHQANALTVKQIEAELHHGLKGQAKEALVSDVLENLLGEVETKDLKEFHENYDVVVEGEDDDKPLDLDKVEKYLVVIDEPEEKVQQETKTHHELDDETLEDLAAAFELYLEEQKIVEANLVKEKSTIEHEQVVEPDTTAASITTVYTTTPTPLIAIPAEAAKESWLGSLFGKGHYGSSNEVPESQKLPHPIDVSQPAVLVEPEELETNKLDNQNAWVHEDNLDKEPLDFDIDQRFQSPTPTVGSAEETNAVTHSVPLWLIENSKNQKVETKHIIEDQTEDNDQLLRQLPDDEDEQEVDNRRMELEDKIEGRTEGDDELLPELPENRQTEAEVITEDTAEGEAREVPVDEEKLQTVEEEGPARFDLPVDLSDHQRLNSTPEAVPIYEQQELQRLDVTTEASPVPVSTVDQLNVHEVHTESAPVESREEPTPLTQTGPAVFGLPVDLSDHQQLNSTPEPVPIDEQQELQRLDVTTEASPAPVPTVDQLTTLNTYEVHTESAPIESREEPTPVTQTGPTWFDLPVDLSNNQQLNSTPSPVPIDEQQELLRLDVTTEDSPTPVPKDDQLTTLNIYEVHTESAPVESREEPNAVTQTATSEPDARRFVREEVLKVLNLLEESNGFTELKESITEQDLNGLVDELSRVQVGIRWTEMISALQMLVANKKLDNGDRMVEILEHWKEGEEGHLDDGYFDRTYGNNEPVENRQIQEEIDEVDMEQMQLAQLQAAIMESRDLEEGDHAESVTKRVLFVDDKDNYFDGAYKLNNRTVNQTVPLNGSEILNATHVPLQNETSTVVGNSTTEIPVESRNPRIINEDDNQNELEHSTQDPPVIDETSVPHSLQAEEVTDKLEVTTPQPFPANET